MAYYWYVGRESIGEGFKLWAGDGLKMVPSINRRLANVLYLLFGDDDTLISVPKDEYPHTTPITHDQAIVDDPFGFTFETVRCLAHQSRANLGFQALKHVTVDREGNKETELLKTPRNYLILHEGALNLHRVFVRISAETHAVMQAAGLIALNFDWVRNDWYPVEFSRLLPISTNWARPYALGQGFVLREIIELKLMKDILEARRIELGIPKRVRHDIYYPDSKPARGPRVTYAADHVQYRLVTDEYHEYICPMGLIGDALLDKIDEAYDRLRWLVWIEALMRHAAEIMYHKNEMTAPLTFNWGAPTVFEDGQEVHNGALRRVYGKAAKGLTLVPPTIGDPRYWFFQRYVWKTTELKSVA